MEKKLVLHTFKWLIHDIENFLDEKSTLEKKI